MQISVVIPSYDSESTLGDTLAALESQDTLVEFEVIVVDCSESDGVGRICEKFERVRFFHESERFNPGIGRNRGASQARGRLLAFLDSDVILAPRAIEEAFRFYEKGHQVFGGALELNEEKAIGPASYLEHFFFNHESQSGRSIQARSNLSSALMFFEREIFSNAGGFKDIPRMQDTELTERLIRQGETLHFCPSVVGFQIQDSALSKVLRKIYINGKNLYVIRYREQSLTKRVALGATLPLLTSLKIGRIFARHMRYQKPRQKLITVALTPLLSISGAYWMAGMYRSMLTGEGIGTSRD